MAGAIVKATNKTKSGVRRGGEFFPAGETVERDGISPYRLGEITACSYLDTTVLYDPRKEGSKANTVKGFVAKLAESGQEGLTEDQSESVEGLKDLNSSFEASKAAVALASEHGIDLSAVKPADGEKINKTDVELIIREVEESDASEEVDDEPEEQE